MQEEIWVRVEGHPDYAVSSFGRVCSYKRRRPKMLKPSANRRNGEGYLGVTLDKERCHIHSLIARAFLGERPPFHEVAHLDGNSRNNKADNLEYQTPLQNSKGPRRTRAWGNETGTVVRAVRQAADISTPEAESVIARLVGVSGSVVRSIVEGKTYKWAGGPTQERSSRESREARNHWIRMARDDGHTLKQIGEMVGLSEGRISRICRGLR